MRVMAFSWHQRCEDGATRVRSIAREPAKGGSTRQGTCRVTHHHTPLERRPVHEHAPEVIDDSPTPLTMLASTPFSHAPTINRHRVGAVVKPCGPRGTVLVGLTNGPGAS